MGSKALRIIIPIAAILVGVLVVKSQMGGPGGPGGQSSSAPSGSPTSLPAESKATPGTPSSSAVEPTEGGTASSGGSKPAGGMNSAPQNSGTGAEQEPPASQPSAGSGGPSRQQIEKWQFRTLDGPVTYTPLGDLDAATGSTPERLDFSVRGAGVAQITLRDYYKTLEKAPENRYTLFDENAPKNRPALGLRRIIVNESVLIDAYSEAEASPAPVWREVRPGEFEADVVDGDGQTVLTIERAFTLGPAEGQVSLLQTVTNHTGDGLDIRLEQWGPGDLPYPPGSYGDYRRIRFGYLDPRDAAVVLADDSAFLQARQSLLSTCVKTDNPIVWPNDASREKAYTLAWVATTNRYFALAVHPSADRAVPGAVKALGGVEEVRAYLDAPGKRRLSEISPAEIPFRYASLKLIGPLRTIPAGGQEAFDIGVYAGPLRNSVLAGQEPFDSFNLRSLIVYQMGCAWCTFQWLGHLLLWFLRLIEGDLLGVGIGDWGLAIIILVFCVRALLHPLTKKGQVSMQRFSKKMGALQPELKKLQDKFRDNPKKVQQEQMRLYKEHNVNPAGCLGMLPMFLQMPIWVALYAMLYFAIELRQQPAFYGVFQMFGGWGFLGDLSEPDRFINFGRMIFKDMPVLGSIPILRSLEAINLLPLLMSVIFFLQQKYMTPQNPNITPDQKTQQTIMKWMTVILFPLMLYFSPSGLTLYIITSSTVGILESRYIRAHVDALDRASTGPGGAEAGRKKVVNRAASGGGGSEVRRTPRPRRGD